MEPAGSNEPLIMVVGEAPGSEEDDEGVPFVGPAGRLLRGALGEIGLEEDDILFTNVVRCRPPNNKITKKAINLCSLFAVQEIKEWRVPTLLLGNSPLSGVLGQTGITTWNGVQIEKDGIVYLPAYHPAYVLRNDHVMAEWLMAMSKIVEKPTQHEEFELQYPKTVGDLEAMFTYLSSYQYIAFDTETHGRSAFNEGSKILSVSFAAGSRAYAFPLDHRESWWTEEERARTIEIVHDILDDHDGCVIGHNLKYDQMWMYGVFGIFFHGGGDTMLTSHLIDSRRGIHGLKRLAGIYLGMYEYDEALRVYRLKHPEADPEKGGSYDAIPLEVLLPYGAMDAQATLLLDEVLYGKLSTKQKSLYHEIIVPAGDELAIVQSNGMAIDHYVAERYTEIYKWRRQKVLEEEILSDKKVRKLVKSQQEALDSEICRSLSTRAFPDTIRIEGDYVYGKPKRGKAELHRKRKHFHFNPGSADHLVMLLYDLYKLPVTEKTDSGHPSTEGDHLKQYQEEVPVIKPIRYYKLLSKMISTYLEPAATGAWESDDGKARTNFNLHGAVTGRTSSNDPNFQNIPTPEKEPGTLLETLPIKNIFTHSYADYGQKSFAKIFRKGCLLSVDYSGMELRCFASLAGCVKMLEILHSGKDIHSMVAITSMTHKEIEEITDEEIAALPKSVRYMYKWTNWTLLYGGDEHTLSRLYGLDLADAKRTVKTYYGIFPEVLEYREWCQAFAEENGYIESPYGRREYLPYINDPDLKRKNKAIREAVNMPVQSGASDTLTAALSIVGRELRKADLKARLVNEVHDSLVLDLPFEEVLHAYAICKDVMENIGRYGKIYMPHIDFSWLKAPLVVDGDVGTHYGSLVPLEGKK